MKRHPELQPYKPCDRYKPVSNQAGAADARRSTTAQAKRKNVASAMQHEATQRVVGRGAAGGPQRVSVRPNRGVTNAPNSKNGAEMPDVPRAVRPRPKVSLEEQAWSLRSTLDISNEINSFREISSNSCNNGQSATMVKIKLAPETTVNQPERGSEIITEITGAETGIETDTRTPTQDDSGTEAEPPLIDSSKGSSSSFEPVLVEPRPDDEVQQPLVKMKKHLVTRARIEEEERQSRMQIVESILARLNLSRTS